MKHTPTPWRYRELPHGNDCFVQADRLKPEHPYDIEILGDDTNEDLYPLEQKKADAQRIVACVNALDKFSNEEVERVGYFLMEGLAWKQERDHLMEALKNLTRFAANDFLPGFDGRSDDYKEAFDTALATVREWAGEDFDPFVACLGVRSQQEATVQALKQPPYESTDL